MVDIGTSDKISNLWPTQPSRLIEKSGFKKKQSKNKQHIDKQKDKNDDNEDGPGNNIDEYA